MTFPENRMRRLRKTNALRELFTETRLSPKDLIWPVFVVPGKGVKTPISSLPEVFHYSADVLAEEVSQAYQEGIRGVLLFGVPNENDKDDYGRSALSGDALVPQSIRALKDTVSEMTVMTDVCLCSYTNHGHCGVLAENGEILNDESLDLLSAMALAHAGSGADIVAPSDMMDGRIKSIRGHLDSDAYVDVAVMSYAAKYASHFYGPFRDAAHSNPKETDRKSYQMNPANHREAMQEIAEDVNEGADIIMLKPALAYLDVIHEAKQISTLHLRRIM